MKYQFSLFINKYKGDESIEKPKKISNIAFFYKLIIRKLDFNTLMFPIFQL